MKKSSIEWLVEQFDLEMQDDFHLTKINQAKQMHKQEIIDAHEEGVEQDYYGEAEEYYKNTYEKEN